jgi:hypothetical protein
LESEVVIKTSESTAADHSRHWHDDVSDARDYCGHIVLVIPIHFR